MTWENVTNQPKSKKWALLEYIDKSQRPSKSIIVYKEDKKYQKEFGKYCLWIGDTNGNDLGTHFSFNSRKLVFNIVKELVK